MKASLLYLYLLPPLVFVSCYNLHGQQTINLDSVPSNYNASNSVYSSGGLLFNNSKFVRLVKGSPYFGKGWYPADIKMAEGRHTNILIRLDLLDQELHYLDKSQEYVTNKTFPEIDIRDSATGKMYIFRSGYPPAAGTTARSYFEVLAEGKITLLKLHKKTLSENRPFNSATTEQTIYDTKQYFLVKEQIPERIKLNKTDILNAIPDNRQAVQQYISEKKIKGKSEHDLTDIINYYNSLN